MGEQSMILPDGTIFETWEQDCRYRKEYHVACDHPAASDENDGSIGAPFRTINAAAAIAEAGSHILIHGGVYRECVRPMHSGTGPNEMICYEAYGDGEAVIKASEEVHEFAPSMDWRLYGFGEEPSDQVKVWELKLKPELFSGYQPFCAVNILHDRLFIEYEKTDMTTYLNRRGMVFCDGKPLKQVPLYYMLSKEENSYWVEANGQTVHFRLNDGELPQDHCIEITSREQCFAPEIPFLSYIKVKNLVCAHAAMGAPVPQRGAISCGRGHHWIIEGCTVDWSNAVGIDIGNECWHHNLNPEQTLGYHVIRGCEIRQAGVCGIAGLYSGHNLIEDNRIIGTGWQKMELSWEAGGIKVHNSIGSLIRRNIFQETMRADHLWMDCGNENNRITQNLFLDGIEQREAIFIECSRDGVNLIDHNIFWNVEGRFNESDVVHEAGSKGWYKKCEDDVVNGYAVYGEGTDHLRIIHNLIGKCRSAGYFAKPVSFRMNGLLRGGTAYDAQIYNNLFYECKEAAIKFPNVKNSAQGNLYVKEEAGYLRILSPEPEVCLDLPAWKEFYQLDLDGQEGWFDIEVDAKSYTLKFLPAAKMPFAFGNELERRGFRYDASQITNVERRMMGSGDFYDEEAEEKEVCIPGPFHKIEFGREYQIDPRKR